MSLEDCSKDKLNDFLIQCEINDDIRNNLMKEYINLLDKQKNITSSDLKNKLNNIIDSNIIDEFCDIYENEMNENKLIPDNNENSPDSIIFLSEMNDKLLTKLKTKNFLRTKKLDICKLNKLKKYLIDTENLLIIENKDKDNFFIKNEIYFDDEHHRNLPKCDILYRKVNNYYYVNNDNYFEKCVYYYYELYSNIFAIFDLKNITLEYYNINNKNNKNSVNINSGVAEIGGKYENTNNKKENIIKTMIFNKKNYKNDRYNEFNLKKKVNDQIKYLLNELPLNFRKSMYNINSIISLINNRTKNVLSKFEQIQVIENTNIKKLEIAIKSKFNLTTELGIFGNYEETNYRNESVVYLMEFYDIEENNFIQNINNQTKLKINQIESEELEESEESEESKESEESEELEELEKTIKKEQKKIYENIYKKKLEWVTLKRGDLIPLNAIYGGTTKTDGDVYVGKINNSPGKVNLKYNKIWNYWVQNLGSNQTGTVLISDFEYEWIPIKRGNNIPLNAVCCGLDEYNDKIWVGKSTGNEPGKITCIDNQDPEPKMKNIWCHSAWCGNPSCYVLIIKTNTIINNKKIEEFDNFE